MPRPGESRAVALSGLVFVALDVVALFLPGAPPKAHESAGHIARTLVDHRPELLVAMYVAGLAVIALLFFLAAVWAWLQGGGGDDAFAITAIGGALVGIGAQLVGMLLFYGASYKIAGQHQYALVRGLTDAGNAGVEISKFGFAALIAGTCLAARRLLPAVLFATGLAAAAAAVGSAIPLFSEGSFTQFGGGLDVVGIAPAIVWLAALSLTLSARTTRQRTTGERPLGLALHDLRRGHRIRTPG